MDNNRELIVDCFAGGGGASTGIERALGRSPDIAINHDAVAIAMHTANHPDSIHLREDICDVDPVEATGGRPVGLAWFSPDCTYHSKARGGKPFRDRRRANRIRGLAWIVIRWAKAVRPRVIMLENVEEFQDWGPLTPDNKPCPRRKGMTFRRWKKQLEALGYRVELRELRACDYGAPTIRKRLFIVARCDGRRIVWPAPTHGPGRKPYRTAGECIDWSLSCPSIFERKRPLAENTMKRIARGIKKFVLDNPRPFIVRCNHGGDEFRGQGIDAPMNTITSSYDANGIVTPCLARLGQTGGRGNYVNDIHDPLPTVTSKAEHMLCAPLLSKYHGTTHGESRCRQTTEPMATVDTSNRQAVVAAFLAKHYGGHETPGGQCELPLSTVTAQDHHALVAGHLLNLKGSDRRHRGLDEPAPTICANGTHAGLVAALMAPYYGSGSGETGRDLFDPAPTVTSKDRLQLVTVDIDGETYVLTDIGMRMLQPRELFLAQGFPPDYKIEIEVDGRRLSKAGQVKMCGNSVPPCMPAAMITANFQEQIERARGVA